MTLSEAVEKVERLAHERYRCLFRALPHGQDLIDIELDCPTVPGATYRLELYGPFPGSGVNYITDMRYGRSFPDRLPGLSLQRR